MEHLLEQLGNKILAPSTLHAARPRCLEQVQVVAAFYNADNAIIGGAFTFADLVPAGGTSAFEVTSSVYVAGIARIDVIPSLSSLCLFNR